MLFVVDDCYYHCYSLLDSNCDDGDDGGGTDMGCPLQQLRLLERPRQTRPGRASDVNSLSFKIRMHPMCFRFKKP